VRTRPYQQQTVEAAFAAFLTAAGVEPVGDLKDTPARVARAYLELLQGYDQAPAEILAKSFDTTHKDEEVVREYSGMVVMRHIEVYSLCEHHVLPFVGKAHVAYIPDGKVVGASKLARLVDVFARRLQTQERLTSQVAHALMDNTHAAGVAVQLECEHFCMRMRGVGKQNSVMVTTELVGSMKEPGARAEFLAAIK